MTGCRNRLLIVCHAGIAAAQTAGRIVQAGYPADSVFSSGFSILAGSRFPAADTMPLSYLSRIRTIGQTLSANELRAITLSRRNYKLIDVRTSGEIAAGLIPGACNFEWPAPLIQASPQFDNTANIILYCASGNRAGQARSFLIGQGFDSSRVINFGGFSKWTLAALPYSATPSEDCMCTGLTSLRVGPSAGGADKNAKRPVLSGDRRNAGKISGSEYDPLGRKIEGPRSKLRGILLSPRNNRL